jgi:general secretion pathway protein G
MLAIRARVTEARKSAGGFTLIELLIVVAIIGILASIAVVNVLNALDKAKQKRSMADLRMIGTATEAYQTDVSLYPRSVTSWAGLTGLLEPYYLKAPPDGDGWDNTWDVSTAASGLDYTITSLGKDGLAGPRTGGKTGLFTCDIVFMNGAFFQWPEGMQT